MSAVKVTECVYWVGVVDWNIRNFHGYTYSTPRGTTYNAYVIKDEKTALVDGVYAPFTDEFVSRIREVVDPAKIDHVIVNHIEPDHSGAIPALMRLCPKARMFGTAKCKEGMESLYHETWDFQVVKTGDKLSLGKKTLQFVEAPMIHWPDSMFTYCPEEKLLLPNDAFGQHYGTSERFDDEVPGSVLMEEAAKYYANILWPLASIILRKLEEVQKMNLDIRTIAPSHGIIWRKDPSKIVNAYLGWSKNQTSKKVVIAYETMWGATEKMAKKIVEAVADAGVSAKLYNVPVSDRSEIIHQMFDAKAILIGCSTHDNDMLPNMAGFLEFLKGLKPKNRLGAAFGSQGWAGGALKSVEAALTEAGIQIVQPPLSVKYSPDEKVLSDCYGFGKKIAEAVRAQG